MEATEVVIVGTSWKFPFWLRDLPHNLSVTADFTCTSRAGPSGLVLSLILAHYQVKSIILEKEWTVQEDPRGIVMTGDGVRTLNSIGLGQALADVSQEHDNLNFHLENFKNAPYLKFPQNIDLTGQALPNVLFMAQPKLEKALRQAINDSKYCELRVGCEVTNREELKDGVTIEYSTAHDGSIARGGAGTIKRIRAQWLVGADGKKGIVRKRFLEPAGIIQQVGKYEYTGTWIAANLQISLPTPETHPKLPFWELGITPEQVLEIYWPSDWHFCTHPTQAVATGRFGPIQDRLWRHEFALEKWEAGMNAEELFWDNLTPSITRDRGSIPGLHEPIQYPRDCIKILRCRPFTFVQKVAGPTWHHNRTIIIGDAAHVFPPFGGQGIASGVRDAVGLAWRLMIFLRLGQSTHSPMVENFLANWFSERRQGIDDSADLTMVNGKLTNQKWRVLAYAQAAVGHVLLNLPWLLNIVTRNIFRDDLGYKAVKNGFFMPNYGGGGKLAQIWVQKNSEGKPFMSDAMLHRSKPLMTIIVVPEATKSSSMVNDVRSLVQEVKLDPLVLSDESICVFSLTHDPELSGISTYSPCTLADLSKRGITPFAGYDEKSFLQRLAPGARFAVLRPDTIIFSSCKSVKELKECLESMKSMMN